MQTDKKWMYFVISQLVINAVKYTSIAGREKEFGLLAMFGLTKSQIRRYVITENMIISVASVVTGLFFGMLFSKLFYMAVEAIIDLGGQVSFVISPKALIVTTISFLLVLNIISLMMSFKIKNSNIAELLKGSRVPKKNPKFSKFKAVLSILLIAGSYVAAVMSKAYIVFTMIPIFIVVVVGTRLLFTQFSVYFTDKLKNSRHVFYKGINMITLSQIIYKLKYNAKVMFITSILSGVTLATGSILYFKMFNEIQKDKYDFMGLKKIGVTKQELNKTISFQSFIMFFLPVAIATLHAIFAVKVVGMLHMKYFMFIEAIYIALQAVFYLFSKWMYVKQINSWIE